MNLIYHGGVLSLSVQKFQASYRCVTCIHVFKQSWIMTDKRSITVQAINSEDRNSCDLITEIGNLCPHPSAYQIFF